MSKDIIVKIFGPTADYIGEGLKNLAERRVENLNAILRRAHRKIGDQIEDKKQISPRILRQIWNETTFYEDPVQQEYVAGIISSSRDDTGVDDRGSRMLKIIESMSIYELRVHYAIYRAMIHDYRDITSIAKQQRRDYIQSLISVNSIYDAVFSDLCSVEEFEGVFTHGMYALDQDELIGSFHFGNFDPYIKSQMQDKKLAEKISNNEVNIGSHALLASPTLQGAELFLWAHNAKDIQSIRLFSIPEDKLNEFSELSVPELHYADRSQNHDYSE